MNSHIRGEIDIDRKILIHAFLFSHATLTEESTHPSISEWLHIDAKL
ncbi:hypothetical protein CSUI_004992 [Cystoisospora suis]|uniref:Uncharacterized protein n=1 Tax=Cystoisospora suis TaxID=483139 RepID=A0A2C6K8Q9_9APIC|nr:hypothetical protein CSUI_004992 [Cystoisospora suis]